MNNDLLKVGDRASWESINRTYTGTVLKVDDRGVQVAIDGGGVMVLSTTRSIRYAEAERKRRMAENYKKPTLFTAQKEAGRVQVPQE